MRAPRVVLSRQVRLVLLMAPITSALCGVAVGGVADWCIEQGLDFGQAVWHTHNTLRAVFYLRPPAQWG